MANPRTMSRMWIRSDTLTGCNEVDDIEFLMFPQENRVSFVVIRRQEEFLAGNDFRQS